MHCLAPLRPISRFGAILRGVTAFLGLALPIGGAGADTVPYTISDAARIEAPLGGLIGNPEMGRLLYFNREAAGCSGCHGSPGGPGAVRLPGNEATPELIAIADRMTPAEIRLWIAAPGVIRPGTTMPEYYTALPSTETTPPGTRLTAQQIEDLVSYLARQKTRE